MREKICEILSDACALKETVAPESELKLLSLDSLSFVAAVVAMEETFGIEFEPDELDIAAWKTVGDIIKNVEKKVHAEK